MAQTKMVRLLIENFEQHDFMMFFYTYPAAVSA